MKSWATFAPLLDIIGVIVVLFLLLTVFKHALRASPTTLKIWIGGVFSAFTAGFIEGMPIGSPVGGGVALADGQVHADLGGKHLLIELAHLIAVPFFTGLADIRTYTKSNPPPNIFQPAPIPALQIPVVGPQPPP
jgi:hypothetical protein